ncbi:PLP-dependent transferase [Streptomyces sp. NPDC059224]|uniref:PLP-dependent transferase n=1 Tax=Streptomyces sp. NPDC059224 TaxID=3346775 RepID=UPI003678FD7F
MRVPDLPALATLAAGGAKPVVDSRFATPASIRPLGHGADLVWHSIPKYLGGYSAAMGGIVISGEESRRKAAVAGGTHDVGPAVMCELHAAGVESPVDPARAVIIGGGSRTRSHRARAPP